MNLPSKIVIGSDHAGFEYKEAIKAISGKKKCGNN
jgi:ribose 5-phosphate isomerase RpiB